MLLYVYWHANKTYFVTQFKIQSGWGGVVLNASWSMKSCLCLAPRRSLLAEKHPHLLASSLFLHLSLSLFVATSCFFLFVFFFHSALTLSSFSPFNIYNPVTPLFLSLPAHWKSHTPPLPSLPSLLPYRRSLNRSPSWLQTPPCLFVSTSSPLPGRHSLTKINSFLPPTTLFLPPSPPSPPLFVSAPYSLLLLISSFLPFPPHPLFLFASLFLLIFLPFVFPSCPSSRAFKCDIACRRGAHISLPPAPCEIGTVYITVIYCSN